MEPIYKLLDKNRKAALSVFNKLLRIKGITCDIYYPVKNNSIFNLEDSLIEYNGVPDETKKLLVFNIFQESFIGQDEFDPFTNEAFVLTTFEDKLPLQTKIILNFMGRKLSYKIDDHRNLVPHIKEQLLIKNIVVPLT